MQFRTFFGYTLFGNICLWYCERGENLPQAVTKVKLKKKGVCVFRRNGPLLCLEWRDKKDVTMLRTIHEAVVVEMGKYDALGEKIEKIEWGS